MPKLYDVILSDEERAYLEHLTTSRAISARRGTRAQILLLAAHGWSDAAIAGAVACSVSAVAGARRRWAAHGLTAALGHPPNRPRTSLETRVDDRGARGDPDVLNNHDTSSVC